MKRISLKIYNISIMKILNKINDIIQYATNMYVVKIIVYYIIETRLNPSFVNYKHIANVYHIKKIYIYMYIYYIALFTCFYENSKINYNIY